MQNRGSHNPVFILLFFLVGIAGLAYCVMRDSPEPHADILTPPTPPWRPERAAEAHGSRANGGRPKSSWKPEEPNEGQVRKATFESLYVENVEEDCQEEPIPSVERSNDFGIDDCGLPESSAVEPATDFADETEPVENSRTRKDPWSSDDLFGGPATSEPSEPSAETEEIEETEETEENTSPKPAAFPTDHALMGPDWFIPASQINDEMETRQARIRQVLDHYYRLPFNAQDDSPWSMMHHILAWGADARNYVAAPGTELVSTIGWICGNAPCERERLILIANQRLSPRNGPGLQGHEGQLLAMFAQARLSREQALKVQNRDFTIEDLISAEQLTCRPDMELTFKLIAFSHYLPPDATWADAQGSVWDFQRLIDEEIKAPIIGAACGGTHRLMGLSCAVRACRRDGKEPTDHWDRAQRHVLAYQTAAFHLQNADGSFSSDWFRRRGTWGGIERKVKTTGHIAEWLVYSLPNDQLQRPELTRAIDYLTTALIENRFMTWPKGPLSHAIRALSLYDERVFGNPPGQRRVKRPELATPVPLKPSTLTNTAPSASGTQSIPMRTSNAKPRTSMPFRRGR